MTSAFSGQNSVSLWPASFCTPRPNSCCSRCFLTSYFCIPVPYTEKDIFFGVLVLEGLVGLYRTIQLQLLQHSWSGHRLGLLWYWMVCLGNEQRSFCRFWDSIQVMHFGLLWRLWKKVGETTRPFRYDLNQISYDYTMDVRNRFKGLDLIDSAWWTMDGGSWHFTGDRDQDHPQEKEMQKSIVTVSGGLTNSCEKKRGKKRRRKGKIYPFECRVPKNSKER